MPSNREDCSEVKTNPDDDDDSDENCELDLTGIDDLELGKTNFKKFSQFSEIKIVLLIGFY